MGGRVLEGTAMRLVSFVVPTLREDEIGATLRRLSTHLVGIDGYEFEILLVDDSSEPYKRAMDEATRANDKTFAPRVVAKRVDGPRRGKGAAIRVGVSASGGDIVFTMDADLPVPLDNVEKFLRLLEEGSDAVIGERSFDRNFGHPIRFAVSLVLFGFQRLVVFQSRAFNDTQCGFKAFKGDLARRLAREQIVDGGMVDIEYLYAATLTKARVARVPVIRNPETRQSKINVKRAVRQDPVDLLRIKWNGIRGRYGGRR